MRSACISHIREKKRLERKAAEGVLRRDLKEEREETSCLGSWKLYRGVKTEKDVDIPVWAQTCMNVYIMLLVHSGTETFKPTPYTHFCSYKPAPRIKISVSSMSEKLQETTDGVPGWEQEWAGRACKIASLPGAAV